jgi:thermitase
MIKRLSFTMLFLVALFAMDMRSGWHHAAQPGSQRRDFVADEVIVKFRDGADEFTKDLARFRVSGTRKKLFKYVPGLEVIKLSRVVSVEEAIKLYRQDPDVVYAEPNYILRTTLTPNDPRFVSGEMWGLNNFGQSGGTPDADIDAPEAWNKATGNGNVVVAIIDSGIDYNHPDLASNMFRNEADCNNNGIDDDGNGYVDDCYGIDTQNNDSNPMDDNNHGTHVAGTIGAKGNNGVGVTGINWNIKMMACKFVDASGSGTTESAIDCLEYVKIMKDRGFNIIATSNSWGGGDFSQALFDAIDTQRQRGILFITAAGNGDFFGFPIDNDQTPFYPCTYYLPNIVCVASTTRNDVRSSFSNYGRRTTHIGAPGSDILSTTRNGNYGISSGTSMATPHVTGVAALLKAQDANRDWKAIKNLILAGGDNISSMSDTITQKRLNANGALSCDNSTVLSRLRPISTNITGFIGTPIDLSVLHINCANPNGALTLTVNPGNENLVLMDDGLGSDKSAGDGIYSAQWTPSSFGTFTIDIPGDETVIVTVSDVDSITPNPIDLASPPSTFTITGGGFANLGYGLPAANFYAGSTFIAQARATSMNSNGTAITVPYPTNATSLSGPLPGLRAGTITVKVYNQHANTGSPQWTLLGSTTLTVNDTRPPAGVSSITPNPIDLASPPSSFTITGSTGSGFANLGYGLPAANFYAGSTFIAQARATSMNSNGTTLTIPYPTNATSFSGPLPGLRAGTITVKVYNQHANTGSPQWTLLGSTTLTVNDSRVTAARRR